MGDKKMEITREEKEQTGKYVLQMARLLKDGCYQQEMLLKAVHIIDEALEQEPFINKPCVSSGVCEHDKNNVLDKISGEIEKEIIPRNSDQYDHEAMWQNCGLRMALKVIGKYQKETEKE